MSSLGSHTGMMEPSNQERLTKNLVHKTGDTGDNNADSSAALSMLPDSDPLWFCQTTLAYPVWLYERSESRNSRPVYRNGFQGWVYFRGSFKRVKAFGLLTSVSHYKTPPRRAKNLQGRQSPSESLCNDTRNCGCVSSARCWGWRVMRLLYTSLYCSPPTVKKKRIN